MHRRPPRFTRPDTRFPYPTIFLSAIAGEKAGILKAGVPAVSGVQQPEALAAIERRAAEIGAPLFRAGAEWSATRTADGFTWNDGACGLTLPAPALVGDHQKIGRAHV